ncbi:5-oxoprolinase subunit PxpB [Gluconacetobacter sp. Hr-1-5]|uniref:5-oxoprolinase subunit PxpB n=1 Tax=Gluconacetobacter sp. Hr-1-5 TaxID=3395370 RepID=UPI003B517F51
MTTVPRVSLAGIHGLLFDAACGGFNLATQKRLWAMSRLLSEQEGVAETVPGVNNLLVLFHPDGIGHRYQSDILLAAWEAAEVDDMPMREIEIPIAYGVGVEEDLRDISRMTGLTPSEIFAQHEAARYFVVAVGAMPGFPYMAGLPGALDIPRRARPRNNVSVGTVVIGGGLAGIMPCTAPTGWYGVGTTETVLFSLDRPHGPSLLRPGDRVTFRSVGR